MLERRESQAHTEYHILVFVGHRPARGHAGAQAPFAAFVAAHVAQEGRVGHAAPLPLGERAPPNGLRFGTSSDVLPEAFELLEIPRVDQFVIPKRGCQLSLHAYGYFTVGFSMKRNV